ncbi:hypothetical protein [Candidatus Liberibacter sp.]|uniref:hypothetical protein n=1 Tax=Candidatus Liberibacter sp. TaxID=34022 RepID=UPI001C71539C|nr:hypothetical protein [Candidatus Liberibacter sp.]
MIDEEKREKARANRRKYRLNNPDKVKEITRKYRLNNLDKNQRSRKYRLKNKDKIKESQRRSYLKRYNKSEIEIPNNPMDYTASEESKEHNNVLRDIENMFEN